MMCSSLLRTCVRLLIVAGGLALLAGCASPPSKPALHPSTRFDAFIPSGAVGYETGPNQSIVLGPAISQSPPDYPAALVARRLPPQRVCLVVTIDRQGKVTRTEPLYSVDVCPGPGTVPAAFVTAAETAARHWRFLPTHLCTFPAGVDASKEGPNCRAEGARVQRLAIKLAFNFTYSVEAGVPRVKTQSMPASHPHNRQ